MDVTGSIANLSGEYIGSGNTFTRKDAVVFVWLVPDGVVKFVMPTVSSAGDQYWRILTARCFKSE